MAFGLTNLGVVLVPYPPNSEESLKSAVEVGLRPLTQKPDKEQQASLPCRISEIG